jgi:hypothetical protein
MHTQFLTIFVLTHPTSTCLQAIKIQNLKII